MSSGTHSHLLEPTTLLHPNRASEIGFPLVPTTRTLFVSRSPTSTDIISQNCATSSISIYVCKNGVHVMNYEYMNLLNANLFLIQILWSRHFNEHYLDLGSWVQE